MRTGVIGALIGALGLLLATQAGFAQGTTPPPSPGQNAPVFKAEELDQILAPIALYPDQLLAQVLMASTYPLEIVQAERWVKDPNNAKLTGDKLGRRTRAADVGSQREVSRALPAGLADDE